MTNIYEINDLVDFLEKYEISVKQFTYCLLLSHDKKHNRIEGSHRISRPLSKIYKFHNNIEPFYKKELQDLKNKGFITLSKKNSYDPDMIDVTDKFEKNWYGSKYKFEQLRDIYPKRVQIDNGSKIPLNTISDYQSTSDLYNRFAKTYKMHNRIMALVEWAKQTNNLNVGIEKFVSSKYWETLQTIRDEELDSNLSSL